MCGERLQVHGQHFRLFELWETVGILLLQNFYYSYQPENIAILVSYNIQAITTCIRKKCAVKIYSFYL